MHKNHHFDLNPKNFWGPSPDLTPTGEGDTPPHIPPPSAPADTPLSIGTSHTTLYALIYSKYLLTKTESR